MLFDRSVSIAAGCAPCQAPAARSALRRLRRPVAPAVHKDADGQRMVCGIGPGVVLAASVQTTARLWTR